MIERTAGCRFLEVDDPIQGTKIPLAILYPAEAREQEVRFGPYSVTLALDAAVASDTLGLVVISHGSGGTPWAYRDLAKHLARAGFVVALPEHPGNNRNDNSLAGSAVNLENRPRHLSLAITAALQQSFLAERLASDGAAVIGHSIGAYTGLALAGGKPWAAAHETVQALPQPVPVRADERIRSLVLLMPALFWFPTGSLSEVRVPILIRTGQKDTITPPSHANSVIDGVPDPSVVEHQTISDAGHFSVMSKFPPSMIRPDFPPSQDPPGFDRELIQPSLFCDIERFLRHTLT